MRRSYRALEHDTARLFAIARGGLGVRVSYSRAEGGAVDRLRVVHDVFGHAALGVGFDLQSEFATRLQCRTLFSAAARPAAFCELVGAVTAYVMTGEKPGLRAKVPPVEFLATPARPACTRPRPRAPLHRGARTARS